MLLNDFRLQSVILPDYVTGYISSQLIKCYDVSLCRNEGGPDDVMRTFSQETPTSLAMHRFLNYIPDYKRIPIQDCTDP